MKLTVCLLTLILSIYLPDLNASITDDVVVRIYKDDLKKVYSVFFSDSLEHKVIIDIKKKGQRLQGDTVIGNGFMKHYGLAGLRNGTYKIEVRWDGNILTEEINLRSEKEVLEQSLSVGGKYPSISVNASKYNMDPMNILIQNEEGMLLKMMYWEPHDDYMSREIDLTQFDGYEVQLQVVQEGVNKLEQLIPLY